MISGFHVTLAGQKPYELPLLLNLIGNREPSLEVKSQRSSWQRLNF